MSQRSASLVMVLGLALTVSACNSMGYAPAGMASAEKSLYERLGGKTAITAVVDEPVRLPLSGRPMVSGPNLRFHRLPNLPDS